MAKVTRAFKACLPGDVYPSSFAVGDDVTGEAERIGREMGCVEDAPTKKALKGAPENKSE
jgi:hypothetical protein